MPVPAHSRPLLDDRRPGGFTSLLGRLSLAIDRTASDGPLALNPLSRRNTLMVPIGSTGRVLSERQEPGGAGGWFGVGRVVGR